MFNIIIKKLKEKKIIEFQIIRLTSLPSTTQSGIKVVPWSRTRMVRTFLSFFLHFMLTHLFFKWKFMIENVRRAVLGNRRFQFYFSRKKNKFM